MATHFFDSARIAVERSMRGYNVPAAFDAPAWSIRDLTSPDLSRPSLLILGVRGIPAAHGGFETFAEKFALHLVERGWDVTVYCQREAAAGSAMDGRIEFDRWRGVRRISIHVPGSGPRSTILFDWRSMMHARSQRGVPLVLGYNTACFLPLLGVQGRPIVTNMDGVEWKRAKWSAPVKLWFMLNELIACAMSSELIADHPEIEAHLKRRFSGDKITMIPYGAERIDVADPALLEKYGLQPDKFVVSIARVEPENSILEMVRAFSRRPRAFKLACVGGMDPKNPYHRKVRDAASDQVLFAGAIYDKPTIESLRRHALAYLHGHTVGGTNPSLVEALGAGSAVIAHRNKYNWWTAGGEQFYFSSEDEFDELLQRLAEEPEAVAQARCGAARQHRAYFGWDRVLLHYEALCSRAMRAQRALAYLALAAVAVLAPRVARAEYLLGPGDKVQIEVSATLMQRATVGADGQIAIPQIGDVKVSGLTLSAAQIRLQQAYRDKNVLENPEVLMEVAEYRPFFIGGDVAKAGGYPYQPGVTVRQAITLAGGLDMVRFRFGENPFLRAADLRNEYEALALDRLRLELKQRRVRQELEGRTKLEFSGLAPSSLPQATIKEIVDLEIERFQQDHDALGRERATLTATIREAQANLMALTAQGKAESEASQQEERNSTTVRGYVDKGVVPTVRLAESLRDFANAKSRYLATESQTSLAKRTLEEAQRQLTSHEDARRASLLAEAQETAITMEKLDSQIKASAEKFAVVGGARSALTARPGEEAEVTIYRRKDNRVERLVVTEDTEIVAGDDVEINLRPQRLLGLAADGKLPASR